MAKDTALKLDHVSMRFNLSSEKVDNIKEYIIKLVKNELMFQEFWALRDISFEVKKGERVGILGMNGAGKSTLLKIIAGVMKPSEGRLKVNGKIAPLLELGAGFDKQYTGAENIYLYGAMLGYTKGFIDEKFRDIVKFSELGDFINVPIKNYSSGMKARLGFSVATVVEPEILILDEVLSVGDARFRRKCERRLRSMFDRGVTVLFVSHSTNQILRMCDWGILLDGGRLIANGSAEDVVRFYEAKLTEIDEQEDK
ncbi:MAG: ABC transporter ATP-binding protein [Eubacterium sp.]|nr:ABC transporter ATP-binding protein [Eubacterium sp.]